MTITDKLEYEKIYKIFKKVIKSKNDLENFIRSLTQNILKQGESHDKISEGLFLLQEEIISLDNFFTYQNGKRLINDYKTGTKSHIEKSIYDYETLVYCGNKEFLSYKDTTNIDSEVQRILDSVDEDDILESFIKLLNSEIKLEDGILKNIGSEFLTINNKPSKMISTDRIFVYSALLNYSRSEIEKTNYYKEKLKTDFGENILNNWDQIRRIFIEFLENLSKRTINY